ncbi:MAG: hypothetical protein IPP32_05710 [Bacteroidetes bacterium]|nr:hypothetical protein [Bacteroidota bacterium]
MLEQTTNYLFDIYQTLSREKVLLSYLGEVTPDLTNSVLKSVKNEQNPYNEKVHIKKKIYNIIVESLENIYKHFDVKEKIAAPSIFLFGAHAEHYYIISGNYVYNETGYRIKETIDELNSLDKENMRKKYRSALLQSVDENGMQQNVAGIGLIDMALKSENKLEYQFREASAGITFFTLIVKVNMN